MKKQSLQYWKGLALVFAGLAVASLTLCWQRGGAWQALPFSTASSRVQAAGGQLPLSFEANRGQTDAAVHYLARGAGYQIFLTAQEAVLQMRQAAGGAQTEPARAAVLRMRLAAANATPSITGEKELPGHSNYFIGNAAQSWRQGVPSYERVRYHNVYDGVEVVYYGRGRQLEYDFIVAPQADPQRIRWELTGADKLEIDPAGDLVIQLDGGAVRWHKPVAYQEYNGERRAVAAEFRLPSDAAHNQVGFALGAYDHSLPLVIDPILTYSTYLGGGNFDEGHGIAVDAAGNIYVAGVTTSANFPLLNAVDGAQASSEAFVTKLTPNGAQFVYSTYFGGGSQDGANAIAVDANGNAYFTGYTSSNDFPFSAGAFQTMLRDGQDAFAVKLNPNGGLAYATYLGGISQNIFGDVGKGIAVDAAGNAHLTGYTASRDNPDTPLVNEGFPVSGDALQPPPPNSSNDPASAFYTKLNASGTGLLYSTYLRGDFYEEGRGIAVDTNGNAYLTGFTYSSNFPVLNAFQPSYAGTGGDGSNGVSGDAFVMKFAGNTLAWSSYLGGTTRDYGNAIAVDAAGNAYLTGVTDSTNFPVTPGVFKTGNTNAFDAFVAKVSTAGAKLYATYLGANNQNEEGYAIAVNAAGEAFVAGTAPAGFPVVNPLVTGVGGNNDAFVTRLNATGTALKFSTLLGGSPINTGGTDVGFGIAVDAANTIYLTGYTQAPDFPTVNPLQTHQTGLDPTNAFVSKICSPAIAPAGQSFPMAGGTGTVNVSAPGLCPWTATSNAAWLTITTGTPGNANGAVGFSVAANTTSTSRTGTLTVATETFTVMQDGCAPVTVNPATLPNATAGLAYNQTLTATGGTAAYSFAVTAGVLPNGLALSMGGSLSGTPTVFGAFNFTVTATDANGCTGARAYTLAINPPCTAITVNPAALPNGFVSAAYTQTLSATGGTAPYTFAVTAGALPNGLALNATSGALSGTPTAQNTYSFTITATDANGCTGARAYTVGISGTGLQFYPLAAPVRLLDTRPGASPNACSQPNAPLNGGTSRTQMARSFCGIPANAQAITGNITTVQSGGGFLTLYPSDAQQPTVASTNYGPNEIINNVFTVGLGNADGAFKIFAFSTTEVVVDVTGYYAPPGTGGLFFHPLPAPVRLLETRVGPPVGCVKPGAPLMGGQDALQTATTACTGIPAAARAIAGNATTVGPQGGGFLTIFPADAQRPLVASSNYGANQIVNGPFTTGLSAAGQFNVFTLATTDLVIDLLGYYSPEAVDANGAGLLFTPLQHPVRLLETRAGQPVGCFKPGAPLNGGQVYTQPARGVCDSLTVPANALGVVGNATVVGPTGGGFLTLWPSSAAQPTTATSNYNAGQVINRHFIVGLGNADGAFKLFSSATTELVLDLAGFFAP